jgi:hypothetical protein
VPEQNSEQTSKQRIRVAICKLNIILVEVVNQAAIRCMASNSGFCKLSSFSCLKSPFSGVFVQPFGLLFVCANEGNARALIAIFYVWSAHMAGGESKDKSYEVSTKFVRDALNKLPAAATVDFRKQIPAGSNYLIENSIVGGQIVGKWDWFVVLFMETVLRCFQVLLLRSTHASPLPTLPSIDTLR